MKYKILTMALISIVQSSFALSIPVNNLRQKSLSNKPHETYMHEQVEKLMKTFEDHFSPLVERQEGKLFFILDWDSDRVVAEARRPNAQDWEIILHGGVIRNNSIGIAELSLILCHELGHHLGGKPTAVRDGWSACEGQADYWSSLVCIKKFKNLLSEVVISDEVTKWCAKHAQASDKDCGAFTQAALNLTRFYGYFQPAGYSQLDAVDFTIATRTFFGHPAPQCRLDTLLSGYLTSARPACWYHH